MTEEGHGLFLGERKKEVKSMYEYFKNKLYFLFNAPSTGCLLLISL